jgi:hypothetical protein
MAGWELQVASRFRNGRLACAGIVREWGGGAIRGELGPDPLPLARSTCEWIREMLVGLRGRCG